MHYGEIKNCDIANGLGVRVMLFVSGCTNHCENCFQPQTWDFNYGTPVSYTHLGEVIVGRIVVNVVLFQHVDELGEGRRDPHALLVLHALVALLEHCLLYTSAGDPRPHRANV